MSSITFVKTEDKTNLKREVGFGERVLYTLEQQRRTKTWLADQIGISKQAINYLLHHSTIPKYVNEIAELLEVSSDWLLFAKGSQQALAEEDTKMICVPVLAPDQIMDYLEMKNSTAKYNSYVHLSNSSLASPSCFATQLENVSMEPLFNQGSLLVFNSEISPKSKDFVIFFNVNDKEIYFRQYHIDGKNIYMKAFDSMFGVFQNADIKILGVLIESRNTFK